MWPRLSVSVNVFGLLPLIFPDFSGIVLDEGCKRVESKRFFFLNLSLPFFPPFWRINKRDKENCSSNSFYLSYFSKVLSIPPPIHLIYSS